MYNKTILLLISLVALLSSSCIKEYCDKSYSTRLIFNYKGSTDSEAISKDMDFATLFIYGNSGDLVRIQPVSKAQLQSSEGILLDLDLKESYSIVCWTNLNENITINNRDILNKATLSFNKAFGKDKLHYGVEKLEANGNTNIDESVVVMSLYPSFITLNIKVVGPKELPAVNVLGFNPIYGFMGKALHGDQSVAYIPKVITENKVYTTSLNVFRPSSLEKTGIQLFIPNDNPFFLDLDKFVQDKYPTLNLDNQKELTIDILIEYKASDDLDVSITIPDWEDNDTSASVN